MPKLKPTKSVADAPRPETVPLSAVGTYYRTTSEFSIDAGLVTAPIGVGLPT